MTRPDRPAARLLEALDGFRDALAEYIATSAPEPVPPAELLTIAEAARRVHVARSTVTRWADTGALATVDLDGRRWVPRAELERLAGTPPTT